MKKLLLSIVVLGFLCSCSNKEQSNFDLSKPIKKSFLEKKISEIIKDSFKVEFDEDTKMSFYKKSTEFHIKDIQSVQDTLKQKLVVNFQLYKPLYDDANGSEMITFVMITFLRKEIDIVEWSYSDDFTKCSEYLFETEKINSSYIKQK